MCPWTATCKSQTIQQQTATVVWSVLDVQNDSNSLLHLCKLKLYTVSNPVHGFVESFAGFTGGPQQFCCCWDVFIWEKTPVFSVSAEVTVQNTYFLYTVSMCCQNITCLKLRAFPGGAGLWGQQWLEPCVPQVSPEGWVLARRRLCCAFWPPAAEMILAGGCSPRGNLRDVKGFCCWILNQRFYSLDTFLSIYFS